MTACGRLFVMSGHPGSHFGRQLKKERLARGWSLEDLARETGINAAHIGRIESGKRPPTERIAAACDHAVPSRQGWFTEYWQELQSWSEVPSWFKPWGEVEMQTTVLHDWSPGVVHGLLQTEGYATEQIALRPDITAEQVAERVANRMTRQQRVLHREDPPKAWFLVDERALYRMAGSAAVMAAQCRHLAEIAALPHVVIQVVPECWHPGVVAGFTVADCTAYTESLIGGQVYGDEQTVSSLAQRFDSIRAEALPASKSRALFQEMTERWDRGVSPATAEGAPTTALRPAPKREWYWYGIPPIDTE
jgi:Domain of unknown function (DUF5753)/Helix-turn-helix